mgnify:CR=1 FL=1
MMRLFPLTIPFMVTAIINEKAEEFADMWSDKTHSLEQSMLIDLFSHISSTGFAIWSNIFSSKGLIYLYPLQQKIFKGCYYK